jgi:integrase/recombinase XerD
MLSKFFKSSLRLQELRCSPAGSSLEGFAHQLCQVGYATTTAQKHIRVAEHFIYWADRKGIAVAALSESSVKSFEHHLLPGCRCPRYGLSYPLNRQNGSTRLFLTYLCDAGVATNSARERAVVEPVLLTAFLQWMRQQRGTSDRTLNNYGPSIRDLLKKVGDDPQQFNARTLRQFVLERTRQSGWGAAKFCATGVRMFLRFLIADGQCPTGLDACIPTGAHWRLSSLPQYLQPGDIERIITSCDRATPVGCRDHAILLLLARMGFRAGDVVGIRLADIDWEQAWIHVSGKGRRQTRLPLTQEIGDAIAGYLLLSRRSMRQR